GIVQSNRVTGTAIEPRGVVAQYDPYKDVLTLWSSTQNPHPLRTYLAETLRMGENQLRVIQPHVGGGFGLKQPTFQEEPLVGYLAMKLRRPVKWIEERSENFQVGGHAPVSMERLPWLRKGRCVVRDGTGDGPRRPRDRKRPGRDSVQELHSAGRVPVPPGLRRGLRQRQLPAGDADRTRDGRLRRLQAAPDGGSRT